MIEQEKNCKSEIKIKIFQENLNHLRHVETERYWYFNIFIIILAGIISGYLMCEDKDKEKYIPALLVVISFASFTFGSMTLKLNLEFYRIMIRNILLIHQIDKNLLPHIHIPLGIVKALKEMEEREYSWLKLLKPSISVSRMTIFFYLWILITSTIILFCLHLCFYRFNTFCICLNNHSLIYLITNFILLILMILNCYEYCKNKKSEKKYLEMSMKKLGKNLEDIIKEVRNFIGDN